MRTYRFETVHPLGDGPWKDEPDKVQWIDDATGLDCLIVRADKTGALCGYVGVPPGHPWHGQPVEAVDAYAHRGLTFADLCGEGDEDGPGVCHVPEPGRPAAVWWLGFATAHIFDYMPTIAARESRGGLSGYPPGQHDMLWSHTVYRTVDYVTEQVCLLAAQAVAAVRS